jgi:hypothetical protein
MQFTSIEFSRYEEDELFHIFLNGRELGYIHHNGDIEFKKKQISKLIDESYHRGYKKGIENIQKDLKSLLGIEQD